MSLVHLTKEQVNQAKFYYDDIVQLLTDIELANDYMSYSEKDFKDLVREQTEKAIDTVVEVKMKDPLFKGHTELELRNELLVDYEEFEKASFYRVRHITQAIEHYEENQQNLKHSKYLLSKLLNVSEKMDTHQMLKLVN